MDKKEKERFLRKVRRWGTSLSISIPPEVIELLDVDEGDIVRIGIEKIKRKKGD